MKLALVTIVKNEERCIERLVSSVRDVVDELIVVDTGSTDRTVDIARTAGASVFHYQWSNDFSQARNFALGLTECPWRLVLDADEWLDTGAPVLREIKELPADFVGRVAIVSRFSDAAHPNESFESRDLVSRLLPKGVSYVGTIHEQPNHQLPVVPLSVSIIHDGYERENLLRKGDRNLQLLENAISTHSPDPYLNFQYARELKRFARFDEASGAIRSAMSGLHHQQVSISLREDIVCLALEIFAATREFSAGLELIESQTDDLAESVDFWFSTGIFSFRLAESMPAVAREALSRMEAAFTYCLNLGAKGRKSRIVCGRESWLAEKNLAAYRGDNHVLQANLGQADA